MCQFPGLLLLLLYVFLFLFVASLHLVSLVGLLCGSPCFSSVRFGAV